MRVVFMLAGIGLLTVFLAGCIDDEIRPTLYLEPDGSAHWIVHVSKVQSDKKEVDKKAKEESDFLDALDKGEDYISEIFQEGGANRIERHLIRDKVPFEYVITAEYETAAEVWRLLFKDEKDIKWEPIQSDDQSGWRFTVDGYEARSDEDEEPFVDIVVVGGFARRTIDGETIDLTTVVIKNKSSWHGLELYW